MRFFFWSGLLTVPRHHYRVSDWRRGRPIRLALRIRTFMGESPAPCWWPTVPKKKKDKKKHTHTHKGPRRIGGFQRKQKPNQTKKKTNNQRKQPPFHLFFVAWILCANSGGGGEFFFIGSQGLIKYPSGRALNSILRPSIGFCWTLLGFYRIVPGL